MYTNDKIVYFLKYLKNHKGSTGEHLGEIIKTHLFITYLTSYATFMGHVEEKGYMYHDQGSKYYITKKGKSFIIKQQSIKLAKISIMYFVVPTFVILTFVFQFIWKPDFLTNQKAKKNQMNTRDLVSDTLSKEKTLQTKSKIDTTQDSLDQTSQKKPPKETQSKEGK